tara:strand:- start:163 stop:1068 length:906 start_codon:yes stop_codon:yes gene_type:complete
VKVSFAEDLSRSDSGKHKFMSRLANEFSKMGVEVLPAKGKGDVFLHIGRNLEKCRCKKKVMRLDGVNFNTDVNYKSMNVKILKNIGISDAVIYQGPFCKKAYETFLGVKKPSACVLNGADPGEFPKREVKNLFLANCKWRPHKRLEETCRSFIQAVEEGVTSKLIVAGKADFKIDHPCIQYVGWCNDKRMANLVSQAIGLIHLSWIDWCPNSMVEAITAGCPVIYSDSGGSPDVAGNTGIAINDKDWDFKPINLYDPPPVDRKEVASAIKELHRSLETVYREELTITHAARGYAEFFESIL